MTDLSTPLGKFDDNDLLTPQEVAVFFKVNPKTVTRWARAGKLPAIRTLGGHRRFRAGDVRAAIEVATEEYDPYS